MEKHKLHWTLANQKINNLSKFYIFLVGFLSFPLDSKTVFSFQCETVVDSIKKRVFTCPDYLTDWLTDWLAAAAANQAEWTFSQLLIFFGKKTFTLAMKNRNFIFFFFISWGFMAFDIKKDKFYDIQYVRV